MQSPMDIWIKLDNLPEIYEKVFAQNTEVNTKNFHVVFWGAIVNFHPQQIVNSFSLVSASTELLFFSAVSHSWM